MKTGEVEMNNLCKAREVFLAALADFLHGRKSDVFALDDIPLLAADGLRHQVSAILYYQLRLTEFQTAFAAASYFAVNRRALLAKIDAAFEGAGVLYMLFKGTEIAQFYQHENLRTMGDVDILVHPEDKQKAHELLIGLGFTRLELSDMRYEWCYKKDDIEVELHHAMIYEKLVTEAKQKDFCDSAWDHAKDATGSKRSMELEFHLVYLLIHIRKHLMNSGVGFRQFMDVAVVATQDIDWQLVRNYLKDTELEKFAGVCFGLINRWFQIETPLASEISDEFYDLATNQIFENGVFGFFNSENDDNGLVNKRRNGRIGYVFKSLFPGRSKLVADGRFSFLEDKPFLLPAARVYRFGLSIKNGSLKEGAHDVCAPIDREKAALREEYLKGWGLM